MFVSHRGQEPLVRALALSLIAGVAAGVGVGGLTVSVGVAGRAVGSVWTAVGVGVAGGRVACRDEGDGAAVEDVGLAGRVAEAAGWRVVTGAGVWTRV